MYPNRDITTSGGTVSLTVDPVFGPPGVSTIVLQDGSIGTTAGGAFDGVYVGTVTYDRFGHLVDYYSSDLGDAELFRDTLHPDGSESHHQYHRGGLDIVTEISADGTKTETRYDFSENDPQPVTTVTPARSVIDISSVSTATGSATKVAYDNGDKVVTSVNSADHTSRIVSYDGTGKIDHEQRLDATGKIVYEAAGLATGDHSVVQKLADGVHTSLYEGANFVFKDLVKNDGSVESYSLAAGQTHGSMTGNDTFNGYADGADNFVFGTDFGNDVIRKFEASLDTITLLDPTISPDKVAISYSGYGHDTVVKFGDEGTITLKGVHIDSLSDLHIKSAGYVFDLMV